MAEAANIIAAPTRAIPHISEALAERDAALQQLGGCGDGGCIIWRPKGMHTNGGCRCSRDYIKMQRFASINNRFASTVRAANV
jgi:hypothetical protein